MTNKKMPRRQVGEKMKEKRRIFRAIGLITQVGISMMVPIFICIFLGYQLDKRLHTQYWFIIFLVLGFLTSFRNVYYLTKSFYAKDKAREDAQMNYFAQLRQNNEEHAPRKKKEKNSVEK